MYDYWWLRTVELTQLYDKSPYANGNVIKTQWEHKHAAQKFDYTAIGDPLTTVKWKRTHIQKILNRPPYQNNWPITMPSGDVIKIDTQTATVIDIIYQKYIQWHPKRTSCAPPIWKRSEMWWLKIEAPIYNQRGWRLWQCPVWREVNIKQEQLSNVEKQTQFSDRLTYEWNQK